MFPSRTIAVSPIPGREGQLLVAAIENQLYPKGDPSSPDYRLIAELGIEMVPMSLKEDGTATRYRVKITSPWRLIRLSDNKELDRGVMRRNTSFNVSDADYSTFVAQKDSLERAITSLGQKYFMRLSSFFNRAAGRV